MKIKKPYQPGQNSTGPKTPEGKESASRNATTHGCRAKHHFILPSESQAEYAVLEASYFREYMPLGAMDERFILRVAELEWVRNRCDRHLQNKRMEFLLLSEDILNWPPEQTKAIDLLEKYAKNADRAWRSAWRDLQTLRRDRLQDLMAKEKVYTARHYNRTKLGLLIKPFRPWTPDEDPPSDSQPGDKNDPTSTPTAKSPEYLTVGGALASPFAE